MENIINIIINNGVTVGVLVYFIYRDNKYITQLTQAIQKLQDTLDDLKTRGNSYENVKGL